VHAIHGVHKTGGYFKKMNDYGYLKEKLFIAIERLALGEKDIRSRIASAYYAMATLDDEDIPPEFVKDWNIFVYEISKKEELRALDGVLVKNRVDETTRAMKNKTARKLAEIIYRMYEKLIINGAYDTK
jgi:hypothetical protein